MSKLNFAKASYNRSRAFLPEQKLINFIIEADASGAEETQVMALQRPGMERWSTLSGPIQGLYASDNDFSTIPATFAVSGDNLYSIEQSGSTLLGAMSGDGGRCAFASNFDRVAVVSGPLLYLYGATKDSTTNSFRNVTLPNSEVIVDVCSLNGYFIIATRSGVFYWLVPGTDDFSGSQDALNFATAESLPDGLVATATLNGNLFLFGKDSVEVWQPTGNADLPFQRTTGQDLQRGCLARDTVRDLDNSLFFVGDDAKVYRVATVPERISTDSIDEHLKLRTGDPSAWNFSYDAHLYYVLRIPGRGSFAYDVAGKVWSEFASEGFDHWRPHVGCKVGSAVICGDSQSGAIWQLSDVSNDDGELMRRTISASAPVSSKPVRLDSITLDVGSESSCDWSIRWADADEVLADQEWISLPARAGTDTLNLYRIGAARSPYRTVEVEVTADVAVRFSGGRLGEAWR